MAIQKCALVTGGAARLGRAIVLALAQAGYRVAIHYQNSEQDAQETARLAGGPQTILQADLGDPLQALDLGRRAVQALGGLDLLVNNAAVFTPTPTLMEAVRQWESILSVNLRAPFLVAAGCASDLAERSGAIVNVSDVYTEFPRRGFLSYNVSKAGVEGLTRSLAVDLAPRVRVNAVAPGAAMVAAGSSPERIAEITSRIPAGRFGTPEDIANAVLYLAEARFVTGQILAVDGGRSVSPD